MSSVIGSISNLRVMAVMLSAGVVVTTAQTHQSMHAGCVGVCVLDFDLCKTKYPGHTYAIDYSTVAGRRREEFVRGCAGADRCATSGFYLSLRRSRLIFSNFPTRFVYKATCEVDIHCKVHVL